MVVFQVRRTLSRLAISAGRGSTSLALMMFKTSTTRSYLRGGLADVQKTTLPF